MKKILIIISTFLCFGTSFAQFAEAPNYEFRSTSSYQYTDYNHQYTIPVADVQQPFSSPIRQRKVVYGDSPGYDPADPGMQDTPLGELDIYLICAMVVSYFILDNIKKRRDSKMLNKNKDE